MVSGYKVLDFLQNSCRVGNMYLPCCQFFGNRWASFLLRCRTPTHSQLCRTLEPCRRCYRSSRACRRWPQKLLASSRGRLISLRIVDWIAFCLLFWVIELFLRKQPSQCYLRCNLMVLLVLSLGLLLAWQQAILEAPQEPMHLALHLMRIRTPKGALLSQATSSSSSKCCRPLPGWILRWPCLSLQTLLSFSNFQKRKKESSSHFLFRVMKSTVQG